MAKHKRSLLLIILIVFVSIGLLSFSTSPSPALQEEYPNDDGWIQITVAAEIFSFDGHLVSNTYWLPAQLLLPITHEGSSMYWRVHGDTAYSALISEGNLSGEISYDLLQPFIYDVSAILYPDCSVEFFIDITEYPGISVSCAPLIGCFPDHVPAKVYPGPIIDIPGGETMGVVSWNEIPNSTGEFIIIIDSMTAGGACNVGRDLP